MTYRVRFEAYALVQLHGLPSEAFDALLDRAVELVEAPWDAVVMPPSDDPAYRQTVFGPGWGPADLPRRQSRTPETGKWAVLSSWAVGMIGDLLGEEGALGFVGG